MKHLIAATAVALTAAHAVQAGGLVTVQVDPIEIEAPQPMGANAAAWLIPLALIAIVVLASTTEEDCNCQASDARLKTDITPVGLADNGLPLYSYRYVGGSQTWVGVMAQDVLAHTPGAVITGPFGLMAVNYGALGLEMRPAQ